MYDIYIYIYLFQMYVSDRVSLQFLKPNESYMHWPCFAFYIFRKKFNVQKVPTYIEKTGRRSWRRPMFLQSQYHIVFNLLPSLRWRQKEILTKQTTNNKQTNNKEVYSSEIQISSTTNILVGKSAVQQSFD